MVWFDDKFSRDAPVPLKEQSAAQLLSEVLRRDSNGEMSHMSSEEDMVSCERSAFILARKLLG